MFRYWDWDDAAKLLCNFFLFPVGSDVLVIGGGESFDGIAEGVFVEGFEEGEVTESAVVLAFVGRFIAMGEGLGMGLVLAEGAEGEGGSEGCGGFGVGGVLAGDFAVKIDGLEGDDATLAPGGDGHAVDGVEFGFSGGAVGSDVSVYESEEAGFGFTVDDDGFGEQAVGGSLGWGGGAFFMAFLGFWAMGF